MIHHTKRYWADDPKRVIWAGNTACMWEKRTAYKVFMEKPGEKRPLERTRKRWKYNINMDLQEIRFEGVDLVDVA